MDLHVALALLTVAGAAYLMILAGIGKRSLDWKRVSRVCHSCGHSIHDCSCRRT